MIGPSTDVVLVDDHPLLQAGMVGLLAAAGLSATPAVIQPAEDMVRSIADLTPRCAVVDLGLPIGGGGLGLIEPLTARGVAVAVLTGEADTILWGSCIQAGAEVVLSKTEPLEEIVATIGAVCRGETVRIQQKATLAAQAQRLLDERRSRLAPFRQLSRREQEILNALIEGSGPTEIAERDYVSVQTVRTQIKSVLRKLSVRSQLEAVAQARVTGWQPEQPLHQ